MIPTDILMLAALAVFVLAWWRRSLPGRTVVLAASAMAALGAGLWGVFDDRWQAGLGAGAAGLALLVLLIARWRGRRAAGVPFVSGSAFALLALASAAPLVLFPIAPLPAPEGPHRVGVRTFEIADAARPGVLGAPPGAPRRLLARVWYPAESVDGLRPRPYFTPAEARTTGRGMGSLVGFPPLLSHLKHVRTHSHEDAPLLAGASDLPVVFYSHGYVTFLGQNTALMEDLASHGYVVFSVQHTFDSSPTVFADGHVAPTAAEIGAEAGRKPSKAAIDAIVGADIGARLKGVLDLRDEEAARDSRILRSAPQWVADRLFLHDQLQAGAVPPAIAEIAAASDLASVGEMGMSFGGSTSGAICMIDARCAAGVNLDGGDFHVLALDADIPVPFLMFYSDPALVYASLGAEAGRTPRVYNEFSYERIAAAGARADVYRVSLRDAYHLGLSDFSLFIRRPLRDRLFGPAPASVMIGAQNAFVRGFFDQHLRGRAGDFPRAPLAAYEGWVRPIDLSDVAAWWRGLPQAEQAALEQRIAQARAATPYNDAVREKAP